MLVLRKEIKVGVGIGLTVLGIAGVYGLMASLSNTGSKKGDTALVTADDSKTALVTASPGLPPTDDTPVAPSNVVKPIDTGKGVGDPFAESNRPDGNKANSDIWNSALATGKVSGDMKATSNGNGATVVKAPTVKNESKKGVMVDDTFAPVEPGSTKLAKAAAKSAKTASDSTATVNGDKYVIQAGDTFSTISQKIYGTKKFYLAIAKANPNVNPSRMKIGQEITVPPKEQVATIGGAVEPNAAKLAAPIDATKQYRVAPGDTLSRISQKLYGKSTQWKAIYDANKTTIGPNEAKLKVGMLLELPEKPVR